MPDVLLSFPFAALPPLPEAAALAHWAQGLANQLHSEVLRGVGTYSQALNYLATLESGATAAWPRQTRRRHQSGIQLARRLLKELQGVSPPAAHSLVHVGSPLPGSGVWTAIADGSFRQNCASAGIWLQDPKGLVRAEVAVAIPRASSAVEAELAACLTALTTSVALGARWLVVLVDAQSVLAGMEGRLPLHHSVAEGQLALAADLLEGVEVRKVLRAWTAPADELAASIHKSASSFQ